MTTDVVIGGVILACGRSSRMGGVDKAGVLLGGQPLLTWVVERFAPQVDCLAINSLDQGVAEHYGCPIIGDAIPGYHGPLMGLWSGFSHSSLSTATHLAIVPCDGPFLPKNLVAKLYHAMNAEGADVAMVRYAGYPQPTFSLWHHRVKAQLENAVKERQLCGLKAMANEMKVAYLDWPEVQLQPSVSPFFNINSPQELAEAEALL